MKTAPETKPIKIAQAIPPAVLAALEKAKLAGHNPTPPEHIENEHSNHYFSSCLGCGMPITFLPDGTSRHQAEIDKPCKGSDIRKMMTDMWNANPGNLQGQASLGPKWNKTAAVPKPTHPTHTSDIISRITPLFKERVDSWFVADGSVAWFIWEDGNEYEVTVSPSGLGRHRALREKAGGRADFRGQADEAEDEAIAEAMLEEQ